MCGCGGKMGQVITGLVKDDADAVIVAGVDPAYAGASAYPVFASIEECDVPADVVIDFSSPKALDGILKAAKEKKLAAVLCTTGSAERRKREKTEIGISAVRGGTIVGEHEVIFAGTDEVIEIKHTAYSKAIFGKGAVSAAKFLAGKAPGLYTMKDVIG